MEARRVKGAGKDTAQKARSQPGATRSRPGARSRPARGSSQDAAARRNGEPAGVPSARTQGYEREFLERALHLLLLNRAFDDRVSLLYRQNQIKGGAFSSRGQEAISIGSVLPLQADDVIGPMIRNSGAILAKGLPPGRFLANYLARVDGPTGGRDGNTHLGDLSLGIFAPISMLGALIPVCAGAALAFKMRREPRIALTYIGDGGASIGDFHEGLNFAAALKLGMVLILENNHWAYSTPLARQCAQPAFLKRAEAYGVAGRDIDGNDLLAVYEAVLEAADRARHGGGPTLIVAETFRMKGHAEHDDASYVPREDLANWEGKDPIRRFSGLLLEEERLSESDIESLKERVRVEMEEAMEFAMKSPLPDAGQTGKGVYAE